MATVLVIEDEAPIRENLERFLALEGHVVDSAENGERGMERIRARRPDLILCDVMMPLMTGFEVLAELRRDPALAAIPFVFLTASAEKDNISKGLDLGAADYVTKPFNLLELGALVRRRLAENP
jgi:CheY-like chemotaxis protein